jgi:hypothetical protein
MQSMLVWMQREHGGDFDFIRFFSMVNVKGENNEFCMGFVDGFRRFVLFY